MVYRNIQIDHLGRYDSLFPVVAQWIHREFWVDKPGHSPQTMEARLRLATDPTKIPLSLVAFFDGKPAGTVNLVENDDDERPQLFPWLAALLVLPEYRNNGVGSSLVVEILSKARAMRIEALYLGTDNPGFYRRLGASVHEQRKPNLSLMRIPTIERTNLG